MSSTITTQNSGYMHYR